MRLQHSCFTAMKTDVGPVPCSGGAASCFESREILIPLNIATAMTVAHLPLYVSACLALPVQIVCAPLCAATLSRFLHHVALACSGHGVVRWIISSLESEESWDCRPMTATVSNSGRPLVQLVPLLGS